MKNKKAFVRTSILIVAIVTIVFSITPFGRAFWDLANKSFNLNVQPETENKYPLNIYCLSVGKADSILISCEGEYALIDGATLDMSGEVEIVLKNIGVDKLKTVFGSHPDNDHIGGLPKIINNFAVDEYVQPNFPDELVENDIEQLLLEQTLKNKNIDIHKAELGEVYSVGSAKIEVLAPVKEYTDTNNYSLVLKLTYKDFSMIFCGDIEEKAEKDIIESGADISADCIKIAHHGSKTSSSKEFLNAVGAKYAVISTGYDRNKLPKTKVLERIEKAGAEIYRTDLEGTITVSTDGTEIIISTEADK